MLLDRRASRQAIVGFSEGAPTANYRLVAPSVLWAGLLMLEEAAHHLVKLLGLFFVTGLCWISFPDFDSRW